MSSLYFFIVIKKCEYELIVFFDKKNVNSELSYIHY